jgi:hypothetical protein
MLMALSVLWAGGCATPSAELYRQFQSEDPAQRIDAAVKAGDAKDKGSIPYLVERLNDDESEVRFFSFLALKKITGQTMGYEYYLPLADREAAVQRWREWMTKNSATQPTSQPQTRKST